MDCLGRAAAGAGAGAGAGTSHCGPELWMEQVRALGRPRGKHCSCCGPEAYCGGLGPQPQLDCLDGAPAQAITRTGEGHKYCRSVLLTLESVPSAPSRLADAVGLVNGLPSRADRYPVKHCFFAAFHTAECCVVWGALGAGPPTRVRAVALVCRAEALPFGQPSVLPSGQLLCLWVGIRCKERS